MIYMLSKEWYEKLMQLKQMEGQSQQLMNSDTIALKMQSLGYITTDKQLINFTALGEIALQEYLYLISEKKKTQMILVISIITGVVSLIALIFSLIR